VTLILLDNEYQPVRSNLAGVNLYPGTFLPHGHDIPYMVAAIKYLLSGQPSKRQRKAMGKEAQYNHFFLIGLFTAVLNRC